MKKTMIAGIVGSAFILSLVAGGNVSATPE